MCVRMKIQELELTRNKGARKERLRDGPHDAAVVCITEEDAVVSLVALILDLVPSPKTLMLNYEHRAKKITGTFRTRCSENVGNCSSCLRNRCISFHKGFANFSLVNCMHEPGYEHSASTTRGTRVGQQALGGEKVLCAVHVNPHQQKPDHGPDVVFHA